MLIEGVINMSYYHMKIDGLPRVQFAHTYETTEYQMSFPLRSSFLEISYYEKGNVIRRYENDKETLLAAQSVVTNFWRRPMTTYCTEPLHRHCTVGIQLDYELSPLTSRQLVDMVRAGEQGNELFAIVSDHIPDDSNNIIVEKLIKSIIRAHSVQESSRNLRCTGLVLELLSEVTQACIRNSFSSENQITSPGGVRYSQRAMNYISSHLTEHIGVEAIADYLGISTGYLSAVFRTYTGRTLVQYINHQKCEKIRELMTDKGLSLREAGENLGFTDEHYLSRLFKKYTGQTVREYKALRINDEDFNKN